MGEPETKEFTNAELAACAAREVGQRKRVYPKLVARGAMTREEAAHQTEMMKAIEKIFRAKVEAETTYGRLL